ncbi:MAG: 50S ribosomal protein L5 [Spirochaetes bacterium]|nr:50S ribosomal protein L5 [Spirochaetota bacterium]
MEPRLKERYKKEIKAKLQEEFKFSNPMQIPKVNKIILNMGVGTAVADKKKLDSAVEELSSIAGQKAIKTIAKKSIATFKVREGMEIGCKVTLHGDRMYEFLDRLINIALPRVKDFRGVKDTGFDGRGNFSLGITEQLIFPEIDFDKIDEIKGLNVTIVTSTKNDEEAKALLRFFDMPFRKR